MPAYVYERHPFRRPPELNGDRRLHPVVIVGGGPVGLVAALELALLGIQSVVLQEGDTVSEGSRALCWSQRSLDILDRHGVAEPMIAKGFTWNDGRVFHRDRELYRFSLQPRGVAKFPAFVNLQQYFAEAFLIEAAERRRDMIDLRWASRATGIEQVRDGVRIAVATPEGAYGLHAAWCIAADGARSTIRRQLGLEFEGRVFEDHFLIADVDVAAEIETAERRFWFQPAFGGGATALCHRQGEGMWRVDFQLGWDIDKEAEKRPERVIPRVQAMLGPHPVACTWISIYTFQARRLTRLRHGRVLFAGDAAHQMSPFGARGGNSGIQDAENLAWKLALVVQGRAPETLLDSYDAERGHAADENIRITSRTTDFLTPRSNASRLLRDAVLELAADFPFARAMVNSGRLSTPTWYRDSSLGTPDVDVFARGPRPGEPCPNLPLASGGHLLDRLGGRFQLVVFGAPPTGLGTEVEIVSVGRDLPDPDGSLAAAFDGSEGTAYLVRPDQHVAARFRRCDTVRIMAARGRAMGRQGGK